MDINVFILAAGRGKRLGSLTNDQPKILLKLDERMTLLDYHVYILTHFCDIYPENIHVIAGFKAEKVAKRARNLGISVYINTMYNKYENIYSVYMTKNIITSNNRFASYIILNGDTLLHPAIPKKLISEFKSVRAMHGIHSIGLFAIDKNKKLAEEEMKVLVRNNRIVRFGKDLDPSLATGEYIGISIFDHTGYEKFLKKIEEYVKMEVTNIWYEIVLNSLVNEILMLPVDTETLPWIEIDTPEDYTYAKKLYKEVLKDFIKH